MFEKVNPSHPDKIADRIAGALVDKAYKLQRDPKIAVEVLIGHGTCTIIAETSVRLGNVDDIVKRIAGDINVVYSEYRQDKLLSQNQMNGFKCGDNGVFKGVPITEEQRILSKYAREIYSKYNTDGKYLINNDALIICQSNATRWDIYKMVYTAKDNIIINPLGEWTGGTDVDCGATNRKLGSDMGDAVTGGGLHGKDLSKADVSVNIYAHLIAQKTNKVVEMSCAIGDKKVNGVPYSDIVEVARRYVQSVGGFEKFAEWGLI